MKSIVLFILFVGIATATPVPQPAQNGHSSVQQVEEKQEQVPEQRPDEGQQPEPVPEQKPEEVQRPEPEEVQKPEQKPQPEEGHRPHPHPVQKPEPNPVQKPEPHPGHKPEPHPEQKPGPHPVQKPGPHETEKPEPSPVQKPEPHPGHKPEPHPGHKPEPHPGQKPGPHPGQKPEPTPVQKPEPTPVQKPEPVEQRPDQVEQRPDQVEQRPDQVEQRPDQVEQRPEQVEQKPIVQETQQTEDVRVVQNSADPSVLFSEPINRTTKLLADLNDDIRKYVPSDDVEEVAARESTPVPAVYGAGSVTGDELHERQGDQIAGLIGQINLVADSIEGTINELVASRRYVTAAMLRSMLNYVRRVRVGLERLQNRLQSVQATVTSGSGTTNQAITPSTVISGIQTQINRITTEVSGLMTRIRATFTPGAVTTVYPNPTPGGGR